MQRRRNSTLDTKAILPVHLYGQCADMGRLKNALQQQLFRHARITEDAAQAFGATCGFQAGPLGRSASAAAFSFYPTKNLSRHGRSGPHGHYGSTLLDRRPYALAARPRHDPSGTSTTKSVGTRGMDTLQAAVLRSKTSPYVAGLATSDAATLPRVTTNSSSHPASPPSPGRKIHKRSSPASWFPIPIPARHARLPPIRHPRPSPRRPARPPHRPGHRQRDLLSPAAAPAGRSRPPRLPLRRLPRSRTCRRRGPSPPPLPRAPRRRTGSGSRRHPHFLRLSDANENDYGRVHHRGQHRDLLQHTVSYRLQTTIILSEGAKRRSRRISPPSMDSKSSRQGP